VTLSEAVTVGERIQLLTEDTEATFEVLEVERGRFRVDLAYSGKVFIYGREVNDFHTVDYEAIAMLNVSATQELVKRLLKSEAEAQNTRNELNDLNARVASLEQLLQRFHAEK